MQTNWEVQCIWDSAGVNLCWARAGAYNVPMFAGKFKSIKVYNYLINILSNNIVQTLIV